MCFVWFSWYTTTISLKLQHWRSGICRDDSVIHDVVYIETSPQLLPNQVLHRMRSSVSSFSSHYPLFSLSSFIPYLLTSSTSSSHHLYPSIYVSFNKVFYKAAPPQVVNNPFSLSYVLLKTVISLPPCPTKYGFIFHSIGLTDLLHPSPAPQLKLSSYFRSTFRSAHAFAAHKAIFQMQHFISIFLKFKSSLLLKILFFLLNAVFSPRHDNPTFNFPRTSSIISYHDIQTVEIFCIFQPFLIYHNL